MNNWYVTAANTYLPTKVLRKGTSLHHGTAHKGNITIPRGPAWFCLDSARASEWAGWSSEDKGKPRVLSLALTSPVKLYDVNDLHNWQRFGKMLLGTADPNIWQLARACRQKNIDGWWNVDEVMLAFPEHVLVFKKTSPVQRPEDGDVL